MQARDSSSLRSQEKGVEHPDLHQASLFGVIHGFHGLVNHLHATMKNR